MSSDAVPVEGSQYALPPDATLLGRFGPTEPVRVTVVVRTQDAGADAAAVASPDDLALVEQFGRDHDLTVVSSDAGRAVVVLEGEARAVSQAFGVRLHRYGTREGEHRGHEGPIHVPQSLGAVVTGVFGLNDRPVVRPRSIHVPPGRSERPSLDAEFLIEHYGFPDETGVGQRVGLIELAGGYRSQDIEEFCGPGAVPRITDVVVGSAGNAPEPTDVVGALVRWMRDVARDGTPTTQPPAAGRSTYEVTMDIELVARFAPGAEVVVYFTDNTEEGLLRALEAVIDPAGLRPAVVSLSWSWSERGCQLERRINQLLARAATSGTTVCAASGDFGSRGEPDAADDALNPQFPPTSPYVLACGGTTLALSDAGTVDSEEVWTTEIGMSSGGGVSTIYPRPGWQEGHGVPAAGGFNGRGVPDVAAVADPSSLCPVFVGGEWGPAAGTSASAPIWAALVARMNESIGRPVGLANPLLYGPVATGPAGRPVTLDVTEGTNGAYHAGPGWDACSGLGVPQGRAWRASLIDE